MSRVCCYWGWHCVPFRRLGQFQSLGVWSRVLRCNVDALYMVERGHLSPETSEILLYISIPMATEQPEYYYCHACLTSSTDRETEIQQNHAICPEPRQSSAHTPLSPWGIGLLFLYTQCFSNVKGVRGYLKKMHMKIELWLVCLAQFEQPKHQCHQDSFSRLNANPAQGYHV